MKISYKWLQSYFEEKLPEPDVLAERITFGFAEVEGVEKKGEDTILDIKVLPDRACYALSHRGVAYEVSAILGLPKKAVEYPLPEIKKVRSLSVNVEASDLCPRYMARVVLGVTSKEMSWVGEHLEAVGQRSINPIVDGANLVMFDRGQPLHAFDADKVKGAIVIRRAKEGEKITTIDNREVNLDESVLIIADEDGPLGIAGIKGGKRAEVTTATKNLILESASFDASHIRKTSERLGIKTDASKRFENRLSASLAAKGMEDFSAYLFEMDKTASFGEIMDSYPEKLKVKSLKVAKEELDAKIGIELTDKQVEDIFSRLLFEFEKEKDGWKVTPPLFRADITISEDIAEEVGRIIGYDKVPATLPQNRTEPTVVPKEFYYEWKIREVLTGAGFSEVMTSSFSEQGSVGILKPLAADKSFARPDLRGSFAEALKMNSLNAPLFGAAETRIFEIGRVFTEAGERTALAVGFSGPKKKITIELAATVTLLSEKLGAVLSGETKDGIVECNLDSVFTKLPEPQTWDITIPAVQNNKFQPFSSYPFIVRDVALFVTTETTPESVKKIIKENAGDLVIRGPELFDEFSKDGKKSLAFRIVFQSFDRTLSDEEVNKVMEKIYQTLKGKGWVVR
ncbi:MAG: phenylalanine--tRNA ligase subunit beta [bacterium]|nr:phenylalanine--tRNA ligase subunit beta [bacterium]